MSDAGERFLGLDFGTESVRALLVDRRGRIDGTATAAFAGGQIVRGTAGAERFADPLPARWALQDPDDWVAAAADAVHAALGRGVDPDRVAGIGVAFTSCTVLPALADGTPLARTAWGDRPHAWPKLWKHHGAQAQATRLTEVARDRDESWLDRYGGVVGLEWLHPKLLEVVDDDPAVAAAAEVWLEGGDWFVWQLTGAPSLGGDGDRRADDLVRSTCQAGYKALWSRADGFPSDDYLEACRPGFASIARHLLGAGTFAAPGERAGALSPAAADLLGLRAGTPVSAAAIDAHAGVPGVGVSEPGTLVLVLGTSGCHMIMDAAEHRIPGVAGVVADGILPGSFGYETGQAAVGDAFDWVRRLTGARDHRDLEQDARRIDPGADGLVAVDWFNGCRTPLMDGDLHGAVLGLTLHHGAAHLYRAVLEASACGLAWIVETLREGGVAVDRFVATGGLPQHNALFGEIVAAVLGAPVEVPEVEHGTALGAAVLGALAAGRFAGVDEAVDQMAGAGSALPPPRTIDPDPESVAAYRDVARRYQVAAEAVRALSSALAPDAAGAPAPVTSRVTASASPVRSTSTPALRPASGGRPRPTPTPTMATSPEVRAPFSKQLLKEAP